MVLKVKGRIFTSFCSLGFWVCLAAEKICRFGAVFLSPKQERNNLTQCIVLDATFCLICFIFILFYFSGV